MREAFCLRLMQADGMNDNLSGNPAMPPPTGTTVPGQRGNHRQAPVCPHRSRNGNHIQPPLCPPRSRNGNHKQPPLCPHPSRNGNHKQPPVCLLQTTTDIARQLSRLPWRYFCLYKVLSMMPPDRTPPQAAWRHERR